jgi:hypothetical protein
VIRYKETISYPTVSKPKTVTPEGKIWRETPRGRRLIAKANHRYYQSPKGKQKALELAEKKKLDLRVKRKALLTAHIEKFGVPYRLCEYPRCMRKYKARGLCEPHYQHERRQQLVLQDCNYIIPRDPNKANQQVPKKIKELLSDT